jgi:AcrR family transcriptional regulator
MKSVAKPRRPRGRPRAFDRNAALDIAMRLFWRRGYEATSIAELADAMGINPPSLYGAFGDKKRLFTEAVRRYEAGPGGFAARALVEEQTAERAIRRLLVEAAAVFSDPRYPPGCMVVSAATNCAAHAADVAAALAEKRAAMELALRRRIEAAIGAGELPRATDAGEWAAFYAAVFQGMSIEAGDGAGRPKLLAVAERAMDAWPRSRRGR